VEMGEEDGDILIAEPDEDIEMGEHWSLKAWTSAPHLNINTITIER
jgi:hypothetical protein